MLRLFILLSCLFLSNVIFAVGIVVSHKQEYTTSELIQGYNKVQIDIADSSSGVSRNQFDEYNVDSDGVVINNNRYGSIAEKFGSIDGNQKITKEDSIETVVVEIIGLEPTELKGPIVFTGKNTKFILTNPNGIICNGCSFINAKEVELRTDKYYPINNKEGWIKEEKKNIYIGKDGISNPNGSLVLSAGRIKAEGDLIAKDLLRAEAHAIKQSDNQKYAIEVVGAKITANKAYIIATALDSEVKIANSEFLLDEEKGYLYVEASKAGNIDLAAVESNSNVKFVGGNLNNSGILKSKNIELDLSKNFINSGNIQIQNEWYSDSNDFINKQKIEIGHLFQVNSSSFTIDDGANITAGPISIYLTKEDAGNFYQGANSILESKEGGIELIAPKGKVHFGYKKENTNTGENKDGFVFVGAQLLSHEKPIYIQAKGDVVFDGTHLLGDVFIETNGKVIENNITGSYKISTPGEIKNVESQDQIVPIKMQARVVMRNEEYEIEEVVGHWDECVRDAVIFCALYATRDIRQKVKKIRQVPEYFMDVTLETTFKGNKQFTTKNENIIFKEAAVHSSMIDEVSYLSFFDINRLEENAFVQEQQRLEL